MEKLIWYSIPGALILFAVGLIVPELHKDSIVALSIAGTPVIGFIIHQMWRTWFEARGGYSKKSRKIIDEIIKHYSTDDETAFLIWELTFYSDKIHSSFRDHDRGVWHYVMSFGSVVIAAVISIGILLISGGCKFEYGWWILLYSIVGFIFYWKRRLSVESIGYQEYGMFKRLIKEFNETASTLGVK